MNEVQGWSNGEMMLIGKLEVLGERRAWLPLCPPQI
jgi:hypothetical protein